jgi:hypothetical protein
MIDQKIVLRLETRDDTNRYQNIGCIDQIVRRFRVGDIVDDRISRQILLDSGKPGFIVEDRSIIFVLNNFGENAEKIDNYNKKGRNYNE